MPFPRGNLKQLGRSSIAAEVATMWTSSASSDGAMTTIFGRQAMYVTSKAPQWVGPSAPTRPALSTANLTGSFCRSTSCTTYAQLEDTDGIKINTMPAIHSIEDNGREEG